MAQSGFQSVEPSSNTVTFEDVGRYWFPDNNDTSASSDFVFGTVTVYSIIQVRQKTQKSEKGRANNKRILGDN